MLSESRSADLAENENGSQKGCRIFRLVDYHIEKSEYLLKSEAIIASLEKIVEFWDYWQEYGVGTILTLLSLFPFVVFLS